MRRISIASIVEGDGEVKAVPILLKRLLREHDPALLSTLILEPIRVKRSSIVKKGELERYVELAASKVQRPGAVLILMDADDDLPCVLAPQLLKWAQAARSDTPIAVVLANKEYEGWFLAAAESLRGLQGLPTLLEPPAAPEAIRDAKGWLQDRMPRDRKYDEIIDQPALTAVFNLEAARACPSFDKLYRDITRLLAELAPPDSRT